MLQKIIGTRIKIRKTENISYVEKTQKPEDALTTGTVNGKKHQERVVQCAEHPFR